MNLSRPLLLVLCTVILLAACSEKKETAVVKPPVAVDSQVATLAAITDAIEVTGTLEPKFSVDVKTQIPGLVKQVYVTEWVRVHKGQPLARIDVSETEALLKRAEAGIESAKAGLAQSQVALSRAEREQARVLKLKESGLATQQAVDDAGTETAAASARLAAARAQIGVAEEEARQARARLQKGLVVAPIDGTVALRAVNTGDLASDAAAASPIFRIVDNRILNLTVTVSSADSARIKTGQPLQFTVDSLPGKTFSGTVMYINPELSAGDRSLKVIAEVRNSPEILKGGLFVKGRVVTGNRTNLLLVPRSALATLDMDKKTGSLFVINKAVAQRRDVTIGNVSGDLVELTTGIKPGERYVTRGGFNLTSGDKVATDAGKP